MLLAGCIVPERELQLREARPLGGDVAVLRQGGEVVYAGVRQGNPAWGLPVRVVFSEAKHAPEPGHALEFSGRYRALFEADSLLWLLVEERGQSYWVGITPRGQQHVKPAHEVPPRWGLRPCGQVRSGLWAFHGQRELWLYEPLSGRWERRAEQLLSFAFNPERGELVWLEQQGEHVVLRMLDQQGRALRVRLLDSLPAPPERMALLLDSAGVALCWLRQGARGWELWWRRGVEERRILSTTAREPVLQSLGRQWVIVSGEELVVGDGTGVLARGRGVGSSLLRMRRLASGEVLGADGLHVWRWSLRPVPWWRWGIVVGLGLFGGAVLVHLWRWARRAVLRHWLHAEGARGWLVESKGLRVLPAELQESLRAEKWRHSPRLVRAQRQWWIVLPVASSYVWVREVTEAVENQQFELSQRVVHELRGELERVERELLAMLRQVGVSSEIEPRVRALFRLPRNRLESARRLAEPATMETIRVEELWAQLREGFPELAERGILVCEPPLPRNLTLWGDRQWLAGALSNAVENAWKALRSEEQNGRAQIRVRAYRHRESHPLGRACWRIVIEVVDNGPGLLQQGKHGLGRRIMEKVLQEHGGMVTWEPASQDSPSGKGTRVRFWLPGRGWK